MLAQQQEQKGMQKKVYMVLQNGDFEALVKVCKMN